MATLGALMAVVGGAVLVTLNVVLGPAAPALLPAASDAVFAAIEMPMVPLPVMLEIVTVRVAVPLPLTLMAPVAEPVVFRATSTSASVTAFAPVYVIVYDTGPVAVSVVDGALMVTPGGVLSTPNVVLGPAATAPLPAVSVAVPPAMVMPNEPSPVMPEIVTVRVAVPEPVTPIVPLAVPVVFRVMSVGASVTALAPVYVIV